MPELSTLEQTLDTNKDSKDTLELNESKFAETFKNKDNRDILVNEAKNNFKWLLNEANKNAIKEQALKEINTWENAPDKKTEGTAYNGKIAVLYLYSLLDNENRNDQMTTNDVLNVYEGLRIDKELSASSEKINAELLAADKKDAAEVLTKKFDELSKSKNMYSEENRNQIIKAKVDGDKSITSATDETLDMTKDNTLKTMENVLTKREEKIAEQKENTDTPITYENKDGKWWYYADAIQIPIGSHMNWWAAFDNNKKWLSIPTEFKADQLLNTFMENKDLKNDSMFFPDKSGEPTDTFNFVTKNYPSLSKNSDIKKQIDMQIRDYVENQNSSREYPKIALEKNLNWVSLQIDASWQSYFDIPVSNLKKKSSEWIQSLHLYSQWNMGNNIMINEWIADTPAVEEKKELQQEKISTPSVSDIDITDRTNSVPATENSTPKKVENISSDFFASKKAPTMLDAKPLAGTENKLNIPTETKTTPEVKTETWTTSVDTKEIWTQDIQQLKENFKKLWFETNNNGLPLSFTYTGKNMEKDLGPIVGKSMDYNIARRIAQTNLQLNVLKALNINKATMSIYPRDQKILDPKNKNDSYMVYTTNFIINSITK